MVTGEVVVAVPLKMLAPAPGVASTNRIGEPLIVCDALEKQNKFSELIVNGEAMSLLEAKEFDPVALNCSAVAGSDGGSAPPDQLPATLQFELPLPSQV